MTISWWPVNRDTRIHQALTQGINIIKGVGQVTEISPAAILLGIPVPGEFDLCRFITRLIIWRGEKYQRKSPGRDFVSSNFNQTELVAIKIQ